MKFKLKKKKIALVSVSRSDFGILSNLIKKLQRDSNFNLDFIVAGSHFIKNYGNTIDEVSQSKIKIFKKFKFKLKDDSDISLINFNSAHIRSFGKIFSKRKYEFVILLGDRAEVLSVAFAAILCRLPIVHIHGGEKTLGSYDDSFRHCVSKLSSLHFVTNEIYKKRLIQIGEDTKKIFNVGSLALEKINNFRFLNRDQISKKFKIKFKSKNILITFHPETNMKNNIKKQILEIFKSLENIQDTSFFITYPNTDNENLTIIEEINKYVKKNKNAYVIKSLGQDYYFSLAKEVNLVLGNSSSGLIEVPALNTYTINLGDRQKGREKFKTVFDCQIDSKKIKKKILEIISKKKPNYKINSIINYKKDTSSNIIKLLKKQNKLNLFKDFKDINF